MPSVAEPEHPFLRGGAVAADPDWRTRGTRQENECGKLHQLAVIRASLRVFPQMMEHRERLGGDRAALLYIDPERVKLGLHPSHAHAEDHAIAGEFLNRRD